MKDTEQKCAPGFVEPMLATRVQELPTGPAWEYEVKWDGYRIVAVKSGAEVRLFSRRGASYTEKFRAVTRTVAGIRADTAGWMVRSWRLTPRGGRHFKYCKMGAGCRRDTAWYITLSTFCF